MSGMFGRAIFPLGVQKVVAVPLAALMERWEALFDASQQAAAEGARA